MNNQYPNLVKFIQENALHPDIDQECPHLALKLADRCYSALQIIEKQFQLKYQLSLKQIVDKTPMFSYEQRPQEVKELEEEVLDVLKSEIFLLPPIFYEALSN